MKFSASFFIILVPLILACSEVESVKFEKKTSGKITCDISAEKTTIKAGEVPKIEVMLTNNTDEDVYLIGSLDGSSEEWRFPHCTFSIEKPEKDVVPGTGRCGMMNVLREEDFVLVGPGESFDPFGEVDDHGFFPSWQIQDPEMFRNKGIYKIQFHYSTKPDSIAKYLGSESENDVNRGIKKLFEKVPHVDVSSNILEIEVK